MRITHFKVENYRSIQKTNLIPLKKYTVFLGKNNEGKSNILRALECAIRLVYLYGSAGFVSPRKVDMCYSQQEDFPVNKLSTDEHTTFELRFELSPKEVWDATEGLDAHRSIVVPLKVVVDGKSCAVEMVECVFKKMCEKNNQKSEFYNYIFEKEKYEPFVKSDELNREVDRILNNVSDLESVDVNRIKKEYKLLFERYKKFKKNEPILSGVTLVNTVEKVLQYISKKMSVSYIHSVRSDGYIQSVLNQAIRFRMKEIEEDPDVLLALQVVQDAKQKILDAISLEIQKSIEDIVPQIHSMKLEQVTTNLVRYDQANIEYGLHIDDGNLTRLESKGDGVKSLISLGLFKNKIPQTRHSLVEIDEPESHLHPGAIRELNSVIEELSKTNQIVIATHCPVFVDRKSISSNIIVDKGTARPAEDIKEIRELLGVVPADNMINSSLIVLVEGECDKKILKRYFELESQKINRGLMHGEIVIEAAGGASKVPTMCQVYQGMLANVVCVFDYDAEGKSAYEKSQKNKILNENDLLFVKYGRKKSCEIEDCIKTDITNKAVCIACELNDFVMRANRGTWSENLIHDLPLYGVSAENNVLRKIKIEIVNQVLKSDDFIHPAAEPFMRRIKERIEKYI